MILGNDQLIMIAMTAFDKNIYLCVMYIFLDLCAYNPRADQMSKVNIVISLEPPLQMINTATKTSRQGVDKVKPKDKMLWSHS